VGYVQFGREPARSSALICLNDLKSALGLPDC